ncbi:peptidase S41 [Vibrio ichthyoenteri ATCC 700023]|uniref:Peptidase S41 n=1 Tax=Vibrio ichthyoenteri ATCC 700023 TaxID=870968 RepID=F9RXN5_9VIBR|nr:S41 family peptidase [Vibrio ichthyoenteri]EGU47764.1 peptidase S41 [Vibrio ichthyoenteri ATCC 700023]
MRTVLGLTLFSIFSLVSTTVKSEHATCHQNFTELTKLVENNYAGYADNIRQQIEASEIKTLGHIQYESAVDCFATLSNWLAVFADPHLKITYIDHQQLAKTISSEPQLRWLSDTVLSLYLGDFSATNRESLASFLQRKMPDLLRAEGVIIDVRGNQGSSFLAMRQILELIGTEGYQSLWHVLASPSNKAFYQRLLEQLDSSHSLEITAMYSNLVRQMTAYPNTWVEYNWPSVKQDNVLPNIKKIYVLTDKTVANAAEEFVIAARSNNKVTVIGTNTFGALDYGQVVAYPIGIDQYQVLIPSQKRVWYQYGPIDNKGLPPDIVSHLSGDELLSYTHDLLSQQL